MDIDRNRALGLAEGPLEDAAFYEVYPHQPGAPLDSLLKQCYELVREYTEGYIWQREPFALQASSHARQPWRQDRKSSAASDGLNTPLCLWGRSCYGDNVEDEWFIAWLLAELTRKLPVTARIWDTDGDLLLTEAAYALPEWLKPDVAADRVWLKGGALHIIPLPSEQQPALPKQPAVSEALDLINSAIETVASSQIQAALLARLSDYPQQAKTNMHHAAALIPSTLAAVLQQEPQLVALAVETFYYRDDQDVKAAKQIRHFNIDQEMVEYVVKMSRCLYAQLVSQAYRPPTEYMLPLPSEDTFAAAQLGMKLVSAFEMLLARQESHYTAGSSGRGVESLQKIPGWDAHLESLADKGFFQEEKVGSARHNELMAQAADSFTNSAAFESHQTQAGAPAKKILELMKREYDPAKVLAKPESDAWMAEGHEEIERRIKRSRATDGGLEGAAADQDLAKHFKEFLEGEGDFEGIDDLDKAGSAHSQEDDDTDASWGISPGEGEDLDLDEQGIWREMQRILKFEEEAASRKSENRDESAMLQGDLDNDLSNSYGEGEGEDWDAMTATDSDDQEKEDPGFFDQAYDDAMKLELRSEDAWKGRDLSNLYPSQSFPANEEAEKDELTPVDVDLNLVQNLLASYEAQEGMAGPVGNLAGLLGLQLPGEKD